VGDDHACLAAFPVQRLGALGEQRLVPGNAWTDEVEPPVGQSVVVQCRLDRLNVPLDAPAKAMRRREQQDRLRARGDQVSFSRMTFSRFS
jgi:hypothetical protein